jgi:MFS-type transporter involved in bile tolerance (Atg22 family)
MISWGGSVVFYNSFLPQITEERYEMEIEQGFVYGYVGSVLLLVFNINDYETKSSSDLPKPIPTQGLLIILCTV